MAMKLMRIAKAIAAKAPFPRRVVSRFRAGGTAADGVAYWEARVKKLGRRAVLNTGHPEREFDSMTLRQKREIYPHFLASLQKRDRQVLDFGCGPGRFSGDLARMTGGKATAVDVVRELLAMAPRSDRVEYRLMRQGALPLPDRSMDVVWICLVLCVITAEEELRATVREIDRVLRPGGLLFLVENTADSRSTGRMAFRREEEYLRLFPAAPLRCLHHYYDLGERISVMSGRKHAPAGVIG